MELKVDKTTKILLGAIALGLFLNAIPVVKAEFSLGDSAMLNVIMDSLGDIHSELLLGKGTLLKPAYVECVRGCQ